jgi:hypothetical protein
MRIQFIFWQFILCLVIAVLAGGSTIAVAAEQSQSQPSSSPPSDPPDQPGYRVRPMPEDTFKPSEKVPEDYPVTFPADI